MIDKMRFLRMQLGITQTELALKCETTQQQIAKIETGLVDPKLSTVVRVAEALECDLSQLFYSKIEFLDLINNFIVENQLDLTKIKLIDLNGLLARAKSFPPFHRYWERVEIINNKVCFITKESKDEN